MKKVSLSLLSLLAVALCATSCSKIYRGSNQEARVYEPSNTTPFTRPLKAEAELLSETRINDTWTFDLTPIKRVESLDPNGELPEALKIKALAKSSAKHGADMIIAATFDFSQEKKIGGLFKKVKSNKVTINVTGYPAKFANWAPVSKESGDFEWIGGFYGVDFSKCKKDLPSNVNVVINPEKK